MLTQKQILLIGFQVQLISVAKYLWRAYARWHAENDHGVCGCVGVSVFSPSCRNFLSFSSSRVVVIIHFPPHKSRHKSAVCHHGRAERTWGSLTAESSEKALGGAISHGDMCNLSLMALTEGIICCWNGLSVVCLCACAPKTQVTMFFIKREMMEKLKKLPAANICRL